MYRHLVIIDESSISSLAHVRLTSAVAIVERAVAAGEAAHRVVIIRVLLATRSSATSSQRLSLSVTVHSAT